ncbi:uncharacterized protein LOC107778582 [Nicotiana tabacum]|uniref:Uncharacterized protein LOC107778582 n=1 Tax=Nicotiana tabacum TaxID=4097 RepID=A0A1S3YQ72_TOBAC|nr:PREDICTED: uncharacterized protein LOC107778582 [Nicotiana tabacum]XP_033512897.1 uncharacterized protein LOC117277605 [Nicotiana tomentosiformis]
MKSKVSNENRFMGILALPWKALTKARDSYVNCMTNYSVVNPRKLPKSYSTVSSSTYDNEDFGELIRAASARSIGDNFELNFIMQQQIRQQMISRKVTRSCSVGMARIDEDKPTVLGEDQENVVMTNMKKDLKYPRSRSYAITKKNNGVF